MHRTSSRRRSCKILQRAEELSNDESNADYDGGEDFCCWRKGAAPLEASVAIAETLPTCWNFMYCTIKRALALKDLLVMFSHLERACNGKSPPTKPCCIQRENVVLESPSYQGPLPILPILGSCPPTSSPKSALNQLGILAELQRFGRMHGAREAAELIVGNLLQIPQYTVSWDYSLRLLHERLEDVHQKDMLQLAPYTILLWTCLERSF